jgi:hypothetical protein
MNADRFRDWLATHPLSTLDAWQAEAFRPEGPHELDRDLYRSRADEFRSIPDGDIRLVEDDEAVQDDACVWHWSQCASLIDYGDDGPSPGEFDCDCNTDSAREAAATPERIADGFQ